MAERVRFELTVHQRCTLDFEHCIETMDQPKTRASKRLMGLYTVSSLCGFWCSIAKSCPAFAAEESWYTGLKIPRWKQRAGSIPALGHQAFMRLSTRFNVESRFYLFPQS